MVADGEAGLGQAADILANEKTSGRYRRMVFDGRSATDVSAVQNSREIGGFLQGAATAAPGHVLAALDAVLVDEIARLAADGPTPDEIDRDEIEAHGAVRNTSHLQTCGKKATDKSVAAPV